MSSSESEDDSHRDSKQKRRRKEKKKQRKKDSKSSRNGKSDGPDYDYKQDKAQVELNVENINLPVAKKPPTEAPQEETQTINPAARRAMMMVPMSREQYQAEQSKVREVYDEESGRYRLVRGSGEIIERIVSRSAHQEINRTATRGDGSSFSRSVYQALNRR